MVKIVEVAKVETNSVKRCEQTRFEEDDDDSGNKIDVERRGANGAQSIGELVRRRAGHLFRGGLQHCLLAHVQHGQERRDHHQSADRQQQKNSGNFTDNVFETRHWLGENGINRAVFDVPRHHSRRGDDRQ